MQLVLYHNNLAVCAQKVRLVLAEKELKYEARHLDLRAGESHAPEYVKLNPKGVVPTLVDEGVVVTESTVINEYLDEKFDGASLRPSDPMNRAKMRRWVMKTDTGLRSTCAHVSFAIAFRFQEMSKQLASKTPEARAVLIRRNELGLDYDDARQALQDYVCVIDEMEENLRGSLWLAGDQFTLADCALVPYIYRLESLALDWLWLENTNRRHLADWYERVKRRPSFNAAIVEMVPSEMFAFMRGHGLGVREKAAAILNLKFGEST